MFVEIKKVIEKNFENFEFRSSNAKIWEETLNNIDYVPIDYTNEIINYREKYLGEKNNNFYDTSIIIYKEKTPIALWAFSISYSKFYEISCFGRELKGPLFVRNCSDEEKLKICKRIYSLLNDMQSILKFSMKVTAMQNKEDKFWLEICKKNFYKSNNETVSNFCLKLDSPKEITKYFSPVYRNYYNRWKKNKYSGYNLKILKNDNFEVWNKFKKLHYKVSGKVTRSQKTWDIHFENIKKGKAFLCFIENMSTQEFLGGAYFSLSKDEAYYGIGTYSIDPKEKNIPIGHLIQFAAIEEMINRKIKNYRVGEYTNKSITSEKNKNITFFAKGFSSQERVDQVFSMHK